MTQTPDQTLDWGIQPLTRVPYSVYQGEDLLAREQSEIYHGPNWNYLCLEAELPTPNTYRTTFVGATPVVVTRDEQGTLHAFENRCAHRGALIVLDRAGAAAGFQCVYHAWSYDIEGQLTGVAFERGVRGKGGMPAEFCKSDHGPRRLRVTSFRGLVFGTFSTATPDIEAYLGAQIAPRIRRVLNRPVEIIGRFTQVLPNNWKLYFENVKDSYHASLLHLFFTTFKLNRLSQAGGLIVDDSGGHHVSFSRADSNNTAGREYADQALRADAAGYRLTDPSLLEGFEEFGDDITLQILSVYPGFVLQQIQNCLAVRQILPQGPDRTELNWTYLGFADDSPAHRTIRLKQSNLIGPAGFVSMEDGAVGGFVQRGIAGAPQAAAIIEMGGAATESTDTRASEASVRGFWKRYRAQMNL